MSSLQELKDAAWGLTSAAQRAMAAFGAPEPVAAMLRDLADTLEIAASQLYGTWNAERYEEARQEFSKAQEVVLDRIRRSVQG